MRLMMGMAVGPLRSITDDSRFSCRRKRADRAPWMAPGGTTPVKYRKNTGGRVCQRGGIPAMGAKVDMTRRERISHRSLSLAYREVALASHDHALLLS